MTARDRSFEDRPDERRPGPHPLVLAVDVDAFQLQRGDGPDRIRGDPRGKRLWGPNRNDQSYTVIDVASERAIATRPASASHPHTFAFAPDGTAYLSMESHAVVPGAIDVIDPATLETLRSIPVGLQATGVGVVPLAPSHFR